MEKISTPEELAEGIKMAMARGESLARAKLTFTNAGYRKEDLEAAVGLLDPQTLQQITSPKQQAPGIEVTSKKKNVQPMTSPQKNIQKISSYGQQPINSAVHQNPLVKPKEKPVQKVSGYEKPRGKPSKKWIVILIIILIVLGISLGALFLFKEQIIGFFG